MNPRGRILKGADLIAQRSRGVKDLPVVGSKDFLPVNDWLEGKQIHTRLDERYDFIKEERVERLSLMTSAEWMPEIKRAKVIKKAGKTWESFGYHKDNEDWLLPEEALYLLETNSLELFYGDVRISIERGYAILLEPSNGCSLYQYRTFSYLQKLGYKVLRHSPDITASNDLKKIKLNQCVTLEKCSDVITNEIEKETQRSITDEEVYIIEDEDFIDKTNKTSDNQIDKTSDNQIDIIPLLCSQFSDYSSKNDQSLSKETSQRRKSNCTDDIILIDDDEEDEDNNDDEFVTHIKEENSCSNDSDSSHSSEIIVLSSQFSSLESNKILARWSTFLPEDKFLSTSSASHFNQSEKVIDLCDDEGDVPNIKTEMKDDADFIYIDSDHLHLKSRSDILDSIPSAKNGISFLQCPDFRLIPHNIKPRYNEYKVNLSIRPQRVLSYRVHSPQRALPYRAHRPYYNRNYNGNFHRNRYPNPVQQANPILRQAQEMQAMAMGMMRVASTLMSLQTSSGQQHWGNSQNKYPNLQTLHAGRNGFEHNVGGNHQQQSVANNGWRSQNGTYRFDNYTPHGNYSRNMLPDRRNMAWQNGNRYQQGYQYRSEKPFSISYKTHPCDSMQESQRNDMNRNTEIVILDSDDDNNEEDDDEEVKIEINNVEQNEFNLKRESTLRISNSPKRVRRNESPECLTIMSDELQPIKEERMTSFGNCPSIKQEESNSRISITSEEITVIENSVKVENIIQEDNMNIIHPHTSSTTRHLRVKNENEINRKSIIEINDAIHGSPSDKEPFIGVKIESNENFESSIPNSFTEASTSGSLFSSNVRNVPDVVNAEEGVTCWAQFKLQHELESKNLIEVDDQQFDIQPILKPKDCTSIGNILSSLQIFDSFNVSTYEQVESVKISYDLYLPNVPFKKSLKMLPHYRVIVVESGDNLPSPCEMEKLHQDYQDKIPFLFAVVLEESIAFFHYNTVQLPIQ